MIAEQLQSYLTPLATEQQAAAASLWAFAVNKYAEQPIAELCMTLQNCHGFDTNCLLYAGWLASRHVVRPKWQQWQDACDSSRYWQHTFVSPLRNLKRIIPARAAGELSAIRADLAALELSCERRQLEVLVATDAHMAEVSTTVRGTDQNCIQNFARQNLLAYMTCAQTGAQKAISLTASAAQMQDYGLQLARHLTRPAN
ncbi:TIGR02444 family protein [Allohahella sp. A8]|uniref:TIGR02444 family protein n=1 Tax=Allohahella sp. A8 TaxID=3141461 RepID=UPI000C093CBA|nr:TIGR02444 family protein [Hahellaceae bacterium]